MWCGRRNMPSCQWTARAVIPIAPTISFRFQHDAEAGERAGRIFILHPEGFLVALLLLQVGEGQGVWRLPTLPAQDDEFLRPRPVDHFPGQLPAVARHAEDAERADVILA